LTNAIASLRATLDNFSALAKNIDTNVLVQMQATLTDLRTAVQGVSIMTAPDSPMQTELTGALEQLNNAARSIAELTEFLKRNPNALITGRTPPKEKP
jgi:paraquat-inducible protein B